jgi:hypothetical protein
VVSLLAALTLTAGLAVTPATAAETWPETANLTTWVTTSNISRLTTKQSSPYGYINTSAYQFNTSTGQYRIGVYNNTFGSFSAATGWLTKTSSTRAVDDCANSSYKFRGGFPMNTGYGPVAYGFVYNFATQKAAQATYSPLTGNCSVTASWFTPVAGA